MMMLQILIENTIISRQIRQKRKAPTSSITQLSPCPSFRVLRRNLSADSVPAGKRQYWLIYASERASPSYPTREPRSKL